MVEKTNSEAVVSVLLAITGLELILLVLDFLISKPPYIGLSIVFFKPTTLELNLILLSLGLLNILAAIMIWQQHRLGKIGGIIIAVFDFPIKAALSLGVLYLLLLHKKIKHCFNRKVKVRKPGGVAVVVAICIVNGLQRIFETFTDFLSAINLLVGVSTNYYLFLALITNLITPSSPLFGLLSILVAWGIWNLNRLARIGGIIMAVLIFPLGIIASLVVLYLLIMHKGTRQVFEMR